MNGNSFLLTLEEAANLPVEQVGGKARTLGRLCKAGFPIPMGYVIPANVVKVSGDEAAAKAVYSQLERILKARPGVLWAVRSSAASEDSSQSSFAGQYSSYLDVRPEDVPAFVRRIQASAGSVDPYRFLSGGIASAEDHLAVIVQEMVSAENAGIAFTADPMTGCRDYIWIEMVPGCGSVAADGSAEPLLVRLKRSDLSPEFGQQPALLPSETLTLLGQLALEIEQVLGESQDIEWAYSSGQLVLLQARPLTTGVRGWTRANVAEIMPEPVTPLTWSILQSFLSGRNEGTTQLVRLIGGKVHLRHDLARRSFEWLLAIDSPTLERALGMEKYGDMSRCRFLRPDYWAATLLFLADYSGITHRLDQRVTRFLSTPKPPWFDTSYGQGAIFARIRAWQDWTQAAFRLHLYATTYAIAASRLAGARAKNDGLETRSARIGAMLFELALQACRLELDSFFLISEDLSYLPERLANEVGGPEWLTLFAEFLNEFGERCSNEFELYTPRWSETPAIPLSIVRSYLTGKVEEPGCNREVKLGNAGRLDGFTRMSSLREEMKHAVAEGYSMLRRLFLTIGKQMTGQGYLSSPDDIFFLTTVEVQQLISSDFDFTERIKLRRSRWEGWRQVGTSPTRSTITPQGKRLYGIGVSQGVVKGTARLVHSLADKIQLKPGEVLVLPNADPAWTSLFLQAAAVVCDIGGLMSHSATVAREFGIPAVFNTRQATQRIVDGQTVLVNGNEGWVE